MGAGAFGALGSAGAFFPLSDLLCSLIPDGCGLCVRSLPCHPRLESVARGSSAGQCPPDVAQPGCALPVHGCSGPTMAWEAAWAAPFPGASLASPAPCPVPAEQGWSLELLWDRQGRVTAVSSLQERSGCLESAWRGLPYILAW